MKKFLFHFIKSILLFLILAELLVRILGFAGHTVPNTYIDGEYRLKPNATGIWTKGTSAEIKSRYNINNQGFNSNINYSFEDTSKIYIALIGDSYIEGFHSSVDLSIGRRVEKYLPEHRIEVHEYGISGWNAWNYLKIAKEICDKYQIVYILITDKDLTGGIPSNAKIAGKPSTIRKIYNLSHFLRYMNINRGITRSLQRLGPKRMVPPTKSRKDHIPEYSLLSLYPKNCIFLYEKDKFSYHNEKVSTIEINHLLKPTNFGKQDSHWNDKGRQNCARTIAKSIQEFLYSGLN